MALVAIVYFEPPERAADEIALGNDNFVVDGAYAGVQIQAHRLSEMTDVYRPTPSAAGSPEALWLGNSQLHAINQRREGDTTAPAYASQALGWPTYTLSLPNASLQEHRVLLEWALDCRKPNWLILGLVCDDLREDGLRGEFEALNSPRLQTCLARFPEGERLAKELESMGNLESDTQGTTRSNASLQDRCEERLDDFLTSHWDRWRRRSDTTVAVSLSLYKLRNRTFGITPSTKRRLIPLRTKRNMAAYAEMLKVARTAGLRVLVYITPLRWDIDPPYELSEYREWKQEAADAAHAGGAAFLDLDELVPSDYWGTLLGERIDFMHFQDAGHRLLGKRIAAEIERLDRKADHEPDLPAGH